MLVTRARTRVRACPCSVKCRGVGADLALAAPAPVEIPTGPNAACILARFVAVHICLCSPACVPLHIIWTHDMITLALPVINLCSRGAQCHHPVHLRGAVSSTCALCGHQPVHSVVLCTLWSSSVHSVVILCALCGPVVLCTLWSSTCALCGPVHSVVINLCTLWSSTCALCGHPLYTLWS